MGNALSIFGAQQLAEPQPDLRVLYTTIQEDMALLVEVIADLKKHTEQIYIDSSDYSDMFEDTETRLGIRFAELELRLGEKIESVVGRLLVQDGVGKSGGVEGIPAGSRGCGGAPAVPTGIYVTDENGVCVQVQGVEKESLTEGGSKRRSRGVWSRFRRRK